ncbi:MAG: hypothetical protein WC707_04885 [Candidatus Babeliaceae bacterium]|jgi:2'-5' RNA ligase
MYKKNLLFLIIVTLNASITKTGVYILIAFPAAVTEIIDEKRNRIVKFIQEINCKKTSSYVFEATAFSPHLSLAFVSQEELSIDMVNKKFPELTSSLQKIAQEFKTISITDNVNNAQLEYWPGKFEIECGGLKKKNYVNVVLKTSDNATLTQLATRITGYLKDTYKIEQKFPFSAHITIGRICESHDAPVEELRQELLQQKVPTKTVGTLDMSAFKIKGHDNSEEIFKLL